MLYDISFIYIKNFLPDVFVLIYWVCTIFHQMPTETVNFICVFIFKIRKFSYCFLRVFFLPLMALELTLFCNARKFNRKQQEVVLYKGGNLGTRGVSIFQPSFAAVNSLRKALNGVLNWTIITSSRCYPYSIN